MIRSIRDESMTRSVGSLLVSTSGAFRLLGGGKWAPVQVSRILARMSLGGVAESQHSS